MPKKTITLDDLYQGQQKLVVTISDLYQGQQELSHKFDNLSVKVSGLDSKVGVLAQAVRQNTEDISDLKVYTEAGFDTMNGRFDRLEDQVDRLGSNGISPGYSYER